VQSGRDRAQGLARAAPAAAAHGAARRGARPRAQGSARARPRPRQARGRGGCSGPRGLGGCGGSQRAGAGGEPGAAGPRAGHAYVRGREGRREGAGGPAPSGRRRRARGGSAGWARAGGGTKAAGGVVQGARAARGGRSWARARCAARGCAITQGFGTHGHGGLRSGSFDGGPGLVALGPPRAGLRMQVAGQSPAFAGTALGRARTAGRGAAPAPAPAPARRVTRSSSACLSKPWGAPGLVDGGRAQRKGGAKTAAGAACRRFDLGWAPGAAARPSPVQRGCIAVLGGPGFGPAGLRGGGGRSRSDRRLVAARSAHSGERGAGLAPRGAGARPAAPRAGSALPLARPPPRAGAHSAAPDAGLAYCTMMPAPSFMSSGSSTPSIHTIARAASDAVA
jgi:hypothetical protein